MTPEQLVTALKAEDVPHVRVADAIGLTRPVAWKLLNGQRQLKVKEIEPLTKLLHNWRREQKALAAARAGADVVRDYNTTLPVEHPEQPPIVRDDDNDYVRVAVLPVHGGMGGGGIGDVLQGDDLDHALVPRNLVEDTLRGRASDFLLIRVRGTSMEPIFRHDDELLIDKRDRSPTQPGPFALWDSQWGEYVVKNVERVGADRLRVFSANRDFQDHVVQVGEITIIGRPAWFGRRL